MKTNMENESTWTKIITCNKGTDTIRIRKVKTKVEPLRPRLLHSKPTGQRPHLLH